MAYERTINPPPSIERPICLHLRSKSMIVAGRVEPQHAEEIDAAHCWCNQTQHVIGPDQLQVGPLECIRGRKCFESVG